MRPTKPSIDAVYAAVAARRTVFDGMVWQAPSLSLAAQAFLFNTSLDPEKGDYARIMTSALSVMVSILAVHLMLSQRQAEHADARRLEALKQCLPVDLRVHGSGWAQQRKSTDIGLGPLAKCFLILTPRAITIWSLGLSVFAVASLANIVLIGLGHAGI